LGAREVGGEMVATEGCGYRIDTMRASVSFVCGVKALSVDIVHWLNDVSLIDDVRNVGFTENGLLRARRGFVRWLKIA
jgi:hypothetical protein